MELDMVHKKIWWVGKNVKAYLGHLKKIAEYKRQKNEPIVHVNECTYKKKVLGLGSFIAALYKVL